MKDFTKEQSPDEPAIPRDEGVERPLRQALARYLGGSSPASLFSMWTDWSVHLAMAPDKQADLARRAAGHWLSWMTFVTQGCPDDAEARPILPQTSDRRFRDDGWKSPPFAAWEQGFLLAEDFWDKATSDIPGLDPAHDRAMTFVMRQMLDAVAPTNFVATNPEVLARTVETGGANLQHGVSRFLQDRQKMHRKTGNAQVGKEVATSKGEVVYRNHLIELIQFAPTTDAVHPEPILIVPAWIMKYYILDLSPGNSLVRYLTDHGFTVFMISWRNPGAEDADLGMQTYLDQGPRAAIDHITKATGSAKLHTAGYCLGGTLLSMAAAAMKRDGDDRLASMTLLAAQADFSEPGELALFVSEAQVALLEDLMAQQGYLDGNQMAGAFTMLRSNDLVWSSLIHENMMGEQAEPNDMMAWNADTTRMPYRMHSEYLRGLFLENRLSHGKYRIDGKTVSLTDLDLPICAVGTEKDHVAPWTSVYKIHHLTDADVTFILTNGGHNAGIISEPGHRHRHYRMATTPHAGRYLDHEAWRKETHVQDGSWWTG